MATITATGTWPDATVPPKLDVKGRNVGGSGVEFKNMGDDDFDSRASLALDKNLFGEVSQFIALVAAGISVTPNAAIDHIMKILADMRRNPAMGERLYKQ
jgi:hypothetical protein